MIPCKLVIHLFSGHCWTGDHLLVFIKDVNNSLKTAPDSLSSLFFLTSLSLEWCPRLVLQRFKGFYQKEIKVYDMQEENMLCFI